MKRKCDYCTDEVEPDSTMCDYCIKSFSKTARKMKVKTHTQPLRGESEIKQGDIK